ncbi:MAG: hypothetical protein ACI8QS_001579 [Planctomycetota bacterium]|jgi:hypothetical protein
MSSEPQQEIVTGAAGTQAEGDSPRGEVGTGGAKRPRKRHSLGPVDTGRPPSMPSALGVVLRIGVFALFLLGTLAVLRQVAGPGGGDLIASKRQVFEHRAGQVDTLVIGSSHVYRAVVPELLDRALLEGGVTARSYNFGIQLPDLLELRFLLREALGYSVVSGQGEPDQVKVRRVVLEYMYLRPQIDPLNSFLPRTVYWHDFAQTMLAAERAGFWSREVEGGYSFFEKTATGADGEEIPLRPYSTTGLLDRALPTDVRVQRDHFLHWFTKLGMVGRHKDLARGLLGRRQPLFHWVSTSAGYVSLEEEEARLDRFGIRDNLYLKRRELFESEPEVFLDGVQRLRTEERVFGDENWLQSDLFRVSDLEVMRQIRDDCRAAGAELVIMVMPSNSTDRGLEASLEGILEVPVLIYSDPKLNPEFFDPALRYDSGHFNESGARAFTAVLAADLLRLIGEGRLQ